MLLKQSDAELFGLMNRSARIVVEGGNALVNFSIDGIHLDRKLAKLNVLEVEIEQILHCIIGSIKNRFLLPLDRADILRLAQRFSKVLYNIAGVCRQLQIYQLSRCDERFRAMIKALQCSLICQETAVNLIDKIELNHSRILGYCERISRINKRQDNLYCYGIINLLNNHQNPYSTIKKREIYKAIVKTQNQVFGIAEILTLFCIKYT